MKVGLTGGVATGKTLVSKELKKLGAHVIDADVISREITGPGAPAYMEIVNEFGEGILREDKTIDRKALGRIVFSDPEKLSVLNRITHPRIIERINSEIAALEERHGDDPLIIVDAALLIEAGLQKDMEKVIVVYADEEKQIERIMKRDGLSEREAGQRIKAQMPIALKLKHADFEVNNNGGIEETLRYVKELYGKIKSG